MIGETLRVNGNASIQGDPGLLATFSIDGKSPLSVLVVKVNAVFFQCSRAIRRTHLWDPSKQRDRGDLPSLGTILGDLSNDESMAQDMMPICPRVYPQRFIDPGSVADE